MKKMLLNYISLLLIPLLILSCGDSESEKTPDQDMQEYEGIRISAVQFDQSNMKLGKMQDKSFPMTVEATGVIDVPPENKAMISSYMDGYVKQTPLLVGDKVKKGQFLLSLENPEYVEMQQQYLDAMEQMRYLKTEYERQKSLFDEKFTSEKNYLRAESEYKRNLARYNGLRKKLEMLNLDPGAIENGNISSVIRLYAPITGSITEMNANNGMYVSAADELMKIIDPEHLHIELDVFEKDILKLEKGQEIRFRIPEAQSDTLDGEVYLVGTSISDTKRTVKVHGHFKEEEEKNHLATGMFVQAEIITDNTNEMALPDNTIVSLDETNYVLVLDSSSEKEYIFSRREVIPGDNQNGFTIIKNSEDFAEDSQFLVRGAFPLITE